MAALLTIAEIWKQPEGPPAEECIEAGAPALSATPLGLQCPRASSVASSHLVCAGTDLPDDTGAPGAPVGALGSAVRGPPRQTSVNMLVNRQRFLG